jgi:hypothetical protein
MVGMKTLKKGEEATVRVFQSFPKPETPKADAQKGTKAPQITEVESSTALVLSESSSAPATPEKELLGSWKLKLIEFENVELIMTDRGIYKKTLRPHNPDQPLKDRKPEFESNARCSFMFRLLVLPRRASTVFLHDLLASLHSNAIGEWSKSVRGSIIIRYWRGVDGAWNRKVFAQHALGRGRSICSSPLLWLRRRRKSGTRFVSSCFCPSFGL